MASQGGTVCGTMWDSVTGAFPEGAALRALYVNGKYASPPVYRKGLVYIDVLATAPSAASWLDVETGDATPADVPGWLAERARYGEGGVYCGLGSLAAVEQAAGDRPHLLWVSTLDGTAVVEVPGGGQVVAVQCIPASMLGFNADMSVVTDAAYWAAHAA